MSSECGVPRNVNGRLRLAQNARAAAHEVVRDAVDGTLVPRDRPRGEEHEVAARELQVGVLVESQPVQGRERLALASGRQAQDPPGGHGVQLAGRDP